MSKKEEKPNRTMMFIISVFVCTETLLMLCFFVSDLLDKTTVSTPLKYCSILMCAAAGWIGAFRNRDFFIAAALTFTCAADLFLLVLLDFYVIGLLLFSGAQFCYSSEIRRLGAPWPAMFSPPLIMLCVLVGGCVLTGNFSPLTCAGALYISLFIGNIVNLVYVSMDGPTANIRRSRIFLLGMLLYFACDILVGVFNLNMAFSVEVREIARIFIWPFYLPGKVLIVLSSFMNTSR